MFGQTLSNMSWKFIAPTSSCINITLTSYANHCGNCHEIHNFWPTPGKWLFPLYYFHEFIFCDVIIYIFFFNFQPIDALLKTSIGDFLSALTDPDLNVRRVALVAFNSAAHNKPSLIRDLLRKYMMFIYKGIIWKLFWTVLKSVYD